MIKWTSESLQLAIVITLITPLLGIYTPLQSYIGITGNPNTSDSLWKGSEDIAIQLKNKSIFKNHSVSLEFNMM
jgi:hypothetical protein